MSWFSRTVTFPLTPMSSLVPCLEFHTPSFYPSFSRLFTSSCIVKVLLSRYLFLFTELTVRVPRLHDLSGDGVSSTPVSSLLQSKHKVSERDTSSLPWTPSSSVYHRSV